MTPSKEQRIVFKIVTTKIRKPKDVVTPSKIKPGPTPMIEVDIVNIISSLSRERFNKLRDFLLTKGGSEFYTRKNGENGFVYISGITIPKFEAILKQFYESEKK